MVDLVTKQNEFLADNFANPGHASEAILDTMENTMRTAHVTERDGAYSGAIAAVKVWGSSLYNLDFGAFCAAKSVGKVSHPVRSVKAIESGRNHWTDACC